MAGAAAQPYGTDDYGGFRNVLPPGTDGTFNGTDIAQFLSLGTYPPHATDQLSMYENLVYATPGLTAAQVPNFFKDATFGVPAGQEERTYSPRAGVTIVRDANFGVPHVYGVTRSDTIFGAGYMGAEDRLFFMDVLRHSGRGPAVGLRRRVEQGDGRPGVGHRALHRGRPAGCRSTRRTTSTAPRVRSSSRT